MITVLAPDLDPYRSSNHDLVALLRRNATVIQAAFATFWSVRLAAAGEPWEIPIGVALVGYLAGRAAFRSTRALRARTALRTERGRQFLRPVTRATVVQLVASGLLPVAASGVGRAHWSLPLVAASIGAFLIVFGRQLRLPAVSIVGWVYTGAALAIPMVVNRADVTTAVSALSAAALMASTVICSKRAGTSLR